MSLLWQASMLLPLVVLWQAARELRRTVRWLSAELRQPASDCHLRRLVTVYNECW